MTTQNFKKTLKKTKKHQKPRFVAKTLKKTKKNKKNNFLQTMG
jgi:hypothetical protein